MTRRSRRRNTASNNAVSTNTVDETVEKPVEIITQDHENSNDVPTLGKRGGGRKRKRHQIEEEVKEPVVEDDDDAAVEISEASASSDSSEGRKHRRKQRCPQRSIQFVDYDYDNVHSLALPYILFTTDTIDKVTDYKHSSSKKKKRTNSRSKAKTLHCRSCDTDRSTCWFFPEDTQLGLLLCNTCSSRHSTFGMSCKSCYYIPNPRELEAQVDRKCPSCSLGVIVQ